MRREHQIRVIIGTIIITVIILIGIIFVLTKLTNNQGDFLNIKKDKESSELTIEDETVKKLYTYVKNKPAIYKYKNINRDNMENEFVLRMTWNAIENSKDILESIEGADIKDYSRYSISKDEFRKVAQRILGDSVRYKDNTFYFNEKYFSTGNGYPLVKYDAKEKKYETNYEFGGGQARAIYEVINSCKKTEDTIEIYVSPIYIDKFDVGNILPILYSGYNFENNKLINEIANNVKLDDYMVKDEDGTYFYFDNEKMSELVDLNVLDSYKYVFKFDKDMNYYYFYEFTKIEK